MLEFSKQERYLHDARANVHDAAIVGAEQSRKQEVGEKERPEEVGAQHCLKAIYCLATDVA